MMIMEMKKDQNIIPAQGANFQMKSPFHPACSVSTECNRSEQVEGSLPILWIHSPSLRVFILKYST